MDLRFLLENYRYEVEIAYDGREALSMVEDFNPSLILSDVLMPEMNGYELCKVIKAGKKTKQIPVILVTALSNTEDMIEGLVYSTDSFISKPYNEEFLLNQIEKILNEKGVLNENLTEIDLEIAIGKSVRKIKSNPSQMLTMLISTYEAVVSKNKELENSHEKLKFLNENLEDLVAERTEALRKLNSEKRQILLNHCT